MLSRSLEKTLNDAFSYAKKHRHEFVTVEHLLFSLLDNEHAQDVLKACEANFERLRVDLGEFLEKTLLSYAKGSKHEVQPNLGFQRVVQRAIIQVQAGGKSDVTGANVLAAMFNEDCQAVNFLMRENVSRLHVLDHIAKNTTRGDDDVNDAIQEHEERYIGSAISEPQSSETAIEKYSVCLNELCLKGKIDPIIGRSFEIDRLAEVLCRRRKNNPLVVGESGVGKTALAEGLAWRIVKGQVPMDLRDHQIYMLDLGSLLAGTKYRGDFEKRFKALLVDFRKIKRSVIFIDEIHTIIGAGSASGGALDAANLLKPYLARGDVRVIGATTYQEHRNLFEKDRALSRRFQKIDVREPSTEETLKIIQGLRKLYEEHHHIQLADDVIQAAVDLSVKYLRDRFLPDKAFDVIDEVGAHRQLAGKEDVYTVTVEDIESTVARLVQIPACQVNCSDRKMLANLERNLKTLVFGQDKAVTQVVNAIKLARSGLITQQKPMGSFLFTGPTGVGKTEVAMQLANYMGVPLLRFDMSEFMERQGASQLIGAPPGYVGYEQGGRLTDAVIKNPYAVLLLDEIEKAHDDIFNLLLQVMDHGTLTDNNGRQVDFRHVILIMTSNTGAEAYDRQDLGFVANENDVGQDIAKAVSMRFRPEFRNRLDGVIAFQPLQETIIVQIVDKFLLELEVSLETKGIRVDFSQSLRDWLKDKGYDPSMGARPMRRMIDQHIKVPLANEILFGNLVEGGQVKVSYCDEVLLDIKNQSTTH